MPAAVILFSLGEFASLCGYERRTASEYCRLPGWKEVGGESRSVCLHSIYAVIVLDDRVEGTLQAFVVGDIRSGERRNMYISLIILPLSLAVVWPR